MANDSSRIWICDSCKTPSQAVEQVLNTEISVNFFYLYTNMYTRANFVFPNFPVKILKTSCETVQHYYKNINKDNFLLKFMRLPFLNS